MTPPSLAEALAISTRPLPRHRNSPPPLVYTPAPVEIVKEWLSIKPLAGKHTLMDLSDDEILAVLPPPREMAILDRFEAAMMQFETCDFPLAHSFTPHLYCRTIFMPAGSLLTSRIHLTEHPFEISKGLVTVRNLKDNTAETYAAPYRGITKPGTRRLLYVHEDVEWTTYHVTDLKDPEEIQRHILLSTEFHSNQKGPQ